MAFSRDYCLISPCRNEKKYMERTIKSILSQSVLPEKWVIVDDGSTDGTTELIQKYEKEHAFIQGVYRKDRGKRSVGPGVIEAFYAGLETVSLFDYAYICKMDMDIEFESHYFESLLREMEKNPYLGSCSGKFYFRDPETGQLSSERCGDEMSIGATKFYRVACFQEIGGFAREVMWDGIDCHKSRMLGWEAWSFKDPTLRVYHLRQMGSSHNNILTGRMRHGFGQYYMGTGILFLLVSVVYRMAWRPFIIGGLMMLWGYLAAALRKAPRYEDVEFRKFLRQYQWKSLIMGKTRAAQVMTRYRPAGAVG